MNDPKVTVTALMDGPDYTGDIETRFDWPDTEGSLALRLNLQKAREVFGKYGNAINGGGGGTSTGPVSRLIVG